MTEEKKEEKKEIEEKPQEENKVEAEESVPVKDEKSEELKGEKEEKGEKGEKEDPALTKSDEKEVEVPKKFKSLVEEVEKMSVLDLSELVKILEKKFGVSASSQVIAAPIGGANQAESGGEEKSAFKIELKSVGDKKIEVIKVVRDLMEKGLKEAKDLVDAVASGSQVIRENAKKDEAEEIKKKFEAAGATVELK